MNTELSASDPWMPIALSRDIPRASSAPLIASGLEVALWRDSNGTAHAWRDRCPHRGMRFSFGFVRGETLTCLYHGWRYGPDGGCRYIPAHPDLEPPKSICAETYPCVESGGIVWMRRGASLDDTAPPAVSSGAVPVRSLAIEAGSDTVDRLLADPAQPFMARPGSRRSGPRLARVSKHLTLIKNTGMRPDWAELFVASQPVDGRRTTLHILVVPAGPADPAVLLTRISRQAERFRRACEAAQTRAALETEIAA